MVAQNEIMLTEEIESRMELLRSSIIQTKIMFANEISVKYSEKRRVCIALSKITCSSADKATSSLHKIRSIISRSNYVVVKVL